MKKLDAKFYLKLSCSAVLLGLFLFLINIPLHRVDSKDYDLLRKSYWYYSSQDEIGEKYFEDKFNRIYNKYGDKYVKAEVLKKFIGNSTDGKTKVKKIKELAKLDVSIGYMVADDYINILNFYGHYDEAYDFALKVQKNYNPCHNFYSTVYNMMTCKMDILFDKVRRQGEQGQKTTFEYFSRRVEDYYNTPIIDKNFLKRSTNKLLQGNDGTWTDIDYAEFCYSMNNLSKAVYHLDKAVANKNITVREIPIYYYIRFGEDYIERGNYKKAVRCFNKYLKYAPSIYSSSIYHPSIGGISYFERAKGSYKLHKKIYDCYLRLGDKKSAEKHKKIMDEMLSW